MRTVAALWMSLVVVLAASGIGWADGSTSAAPAALVNLEIQNTSVVDSIGALFRGRGLSYRIEPGVSGKVVELTLKGVTFDQALKAFTDAAGLAYAVDADGVYVISPVRAKTATAQRTVVEQGGVGQSASAQPEARQPEAAPAQQPMPMPPVGPPASIPVGAGTQVLVSQQAPVIYGSPGGIPIVDNGGYYGPNFQVGNVRFFNDWTPYTIGGVNPYVLNFGQGYPPPPGWVSPEMLRLMRAQYAFQPQPYFITPY